MPRNENLTVARESRGWSQTEAADKIGMSRVHYARLEIGTIAPRGSTVGLICRAFHMSAAALGYPQFRFLGDGSSPTIERLATTSALSAGKSEDISPCAMYSRESFSPTHSAGTSGEQSSAIWFILKQQLIQLLVNQWHGRA
ncbi:MAG: helix-turn-helix domain-containing protein, partial [Ktedonobacteraceae bacterium]